MASDKSLELDKSLEKEIRTAMKAYASTDWDKKLLEASQTGNIFECKEALDNGADVATWHNTLGCKYYTPLHHAAERGDLEMVRLLIEAEASPKAVIISVMNWQTYTPRDLAEKLNHKKVARYLDNAEEHLSRRKVSRNKTVHGLLRSERTGRTKEQA